MMQSHTLVCPHCGNRKFSKEITVDTPVLRCPCCDTTFVTEVGLRLAERSAAETARLENLTRQLREAMKNNDADSLISRAEEIREINPDDYTARYCFAFGKSRRGEQGYIRDFYATPASTATEEELRAVVAHVTENSAFRDWRAVEKYLTGLSGRLADTDALLSEYHRVYDARLQRESDYLDGERDVFVCHSSHDRDAVAEVLRSIEVGGKSYWVSSRNLRPNDSENYWGAITRAIRSCRIFLLVYSKDAARSTDVMRELEIAYQHKKTVLELNLDATPHTEGSVFDRILDGKTWVDASKSLKHGLADLGDRLFDTLLNLPGEDSTAGLADLPEAGGAPSDYEPTYENARLLLERGREMGLGEQWIAEAYRLFLVSAKEGGDPRAWFGLGLCLWFGYGAPRDEMKADRIFGDYYDELEALAESDPAAAYILYEYYRYGLGVYEDEPRATEWLTRAADGGYPRAQYVLSCQAGAKKSVELLEAAYTAGFHLAAYAKANLLFLGYHLTAGRGRTVTADRNAAVHLYREGARAGDPRCRHRLGETFLYKKGFDVFEGRLTAVTDRLPDLQNGILTLPSGVTAIAPKALAGIAGLRILVLPETVAEIAPDAFGEDTVPEIRCAGLAATASVNRLRTARRAARAARARAFFAHPTVWLMTLLLAVGLLVALGGIFGFLRLPNLFMCFYYAAVAVFGLVCFLIPTEYYYKGFLYPAELSLCTLGILGFAFGGWISDRWCVIPAAALLIAAVITVTYKAGVAFFGDDVCDSFAPPILVLLLVALVVPLGALTGLLPLALHPLGSTFAALGFLVTGLLSFFAVDEGDTWMCILGPISILATAIVFFYAGAMAWWISLLLLLTAVPMIIGSTQW